MIVRWAQSVRHRHHRGRIDSPWWCPSPGEAVRDCAGRVAVVVVVDLTSRSAVLDYGAREPHRRRVVDWWGCMAPPDHHDGVHSGAHTRPVFVGRDLITREGSACGRHRRG